MERSKLQSSRAPPVVVPLFIDIIFFLVKLSIGYIFGSLVLVAASFLMLNTMGSLVAAFYVRKSKSTVKYSYGWHRAAILAGIIHGVSILGLCFAVLPDAVERLFSRTGFYWPEFVVLLGAVGLLNSLIGIVLLRDQWSVRGISHTQEDSGTVPQITERSPLVHYEGLPEHYARRPQTDLSQRARTESILAKQKKSVLAHGPMREVFLYTLAGAMGDAAVISTGLILWLTDLPGKEMVDPILSLVMIFLISFYAVPQVKTASVILLQAVPPGIDIQAVHNGVLQLAGVRDLLELHVWQLSEKRIVASVHVSVSREKDYMDVAADIHKLFHDHGIHSCTIQPEFNVENETTDGVESVHADHH